MTRRRGAPVGLDAASPLPALILQLLAPERGFLDALARVYRAPLEVHAEQIVLIRGLEVSAAFLTDERHRERALQRFCEARLEGHALLALHPPSTCCRARERDAQFRLQGAADRDLLLCVLLGRLGFAQLCDDLLRRPIPLLLRPWSPDRGLLHPVHLPGKSYSQTLCVERVASRRLLLFDKQCGCSRGVRDAQ